MNPSCERVSSLTRLSPQQERLWLLQQWQPSSAPVHVVHTYELCGEVDAGRLEACFTHVLRRHEPFQITIEHGGQGPVPRPGTGALARLERREVSADALRPAIAGEAQRLFDLEHGPLARALLFALGARRHVLLLVVHRIVCDDLSARLLADELFAAYESWDGQSDGKPAHKADVETMSPPAPASVVSHEARIAFWKERFTDAPVLELPIDRPRPPELTVAGDRRTVSLDALIPGLSALAQAHGTDVSTVVTAACHALLARYSSSTDLVVGHATSGRPPGMERAIGCYGDMLPIRTDLSGDPSFGTLIEHVRGRAAEAAAHALLFGEILEAVRPPRNLSHAPIVQALVRTFDTRVRPRAGSLTIAPLDSPVTTLRLDLTIDVDTSDGSLACTAEYNSDLFEPSTIARLLSHLRTLLTGAVAAPDTRLSQLPLLTPEESHAICVTWNLTDRPVPADFTVPALIAAQVARTPDAIAVGDGYRSLTYASLLERADALADRLRSAGVGPDRLVGVAMDRTVDLVVALLAVWRAGGAYVPLDVAYPADRLAFMIEDARPTLLITDRASAPRLPEASVPRLVFDAPPDGGITAASDGRGPSAGDLAYVIYTSGSTGRPKGVAIPQGSLVNALLAYQRRPGLQPSDCVLAVATLAFDIAGLDLWLTLITGARVELASRDIAADGPRLLAAARERGATLMQATPATWRLLLAAGWNGTPPLTVLCGGEALTPDLAAALTARSPQVWNLYGPTETTIWCTVARVGDGPITLGDPIDNMRLYVLDAHRALVPIGVPGELYIAGVGLGRGYWNRPELTADRFVSDPFSAVSEPRLYRTGDRVRRRADGSLEYLGRFDHQVKLRGFRIELGEIDATLANEPDVAETVSVVLEMGPDDRRIVTYVVGRPGAPPLDGNALRQSLKRTLPDYMVPATFVVLPRLPRSPNGKVDRRALPPPQRVVTTGRYEAPRSTVEERLAAIWRDLLHVERVGRDDDFFESGGHSLLAVRLFARMQQEFGVHLPLATLIDAPTVAGLAAQLESSDVTARWSALVPIQPQGARLPFFCVHGAGANILCLKILADHLGNDQPFYGLQSVGLDGTTPPHRSVEDMAAHYLHEIRRVQAAGPYLLGGFSLGGAVAFEMAQQLAHAGERVGLVALIDTYFPTVPDYMAPRSSAQQLVYRAAGQIETFLRHRAELGTRRLIRRTLHDAIESARRQIARLGAAWRRSDSSEPLDSIETLRRVVAANLEAAEAYRPQPYAGRVVLFWGTEGSLEHLDTRLCWDLVATGGLEVHIVPGDHNSLREEPHVRVLAAKLRRCLDRTALAARTTARYHERVVKAS